MLWNRFKYLLLGYMLLSAILSIPVNPIFSPIAAVLIFIIILRSLDKDSH